MLNWIFWERFKKKKKKKKAAVTLTQHAKFDNILGEQPMTGITAPAKVVI